MSAKADLLEAARAYLRSVGSNPAEVRFVIIGPDSDGKPITVTADGHENAPSPRPLREQILDVLTEAEGLLRGYQIAKGIGRPGADSYLRVVLSKLVKEGAIMRTPQGYRRT